MSDFTFDEKENYSLDDVKNLLKQHRNVVYAESKKNIEPKLSEYETKIKEYENKVNEYQEKELFNGFNDKQLKIVKSLINTEYKDIDKHSALNKIKEDYAEIFNNNLHNKEIKKQEIIKNEEPKQEFFNPKTLFELDNNITSKNEELLKNTEVVGAKTKQEMIKFLEFLFSK
ncbi:hypothetical protein [Spiroplasma endosymbiont of Danaus chrysippus]|uniref:hypothetical protein n=1 Tax=Spiroplasma endosymbiont of Danaus chrysippus TaxID=2691041 RepID=UPI00157AA731|nr:hypothetical protein [Spiroplasma endosymbiont of Danaus chrysippus]